MFRPTSQQKRYYVVLAIVVIIILSPLLTIPLSSETSASSLSLQLQSLQSLWQKQNCQEKQSLLDTSVGEFDKFRRFKKHMFHVKGEDWQNISSSRQLCLGTQTSVERLDELVELSSAWTGPISVALFTPSHELALALRYIGYLRQCFSSISRHAVFHFVYPADEPNFAPIDETSLPTMDCEQPSAVLLGLMATRGEDFLSWRVSYAYPQNLLRNLAKGGCQTKYTFIPDIDMVPYPGLDLELEDFLSKEEIQSCSKCAYVIPTYEIARDSDRLPHNKTELVQMVKENRARQFHQVVYSLNQQASDLPRWENFPTQPVLAMAYKVEYIFKYEPIYIAHADTPQFDERFIGFGMTRNSQVYEMYVAGYDFHILNNAFTSHWGFQSKNARPGWRVQQQHENIGKFDKFAREVSSRYARDPYKMLDKLRKSPPGRVAY